MLWDPGFSYKASAYPPVVVRRPRFFQCRDADRFHQMVEATSGPNRTRGPWGLAVTASMTRNVMEEDGIRGSNMGTGDTGGSRQAGRIRRLGEPGAAGGCRFIDISHYSALITTTVATP